MARTQKKQAPPEARCKATHAIELMLAAQELSTMAASEDQRRVLTRYVFLYGEPAARWIDRWRQELSDNTETAARAAAGEPAARRLRQAWAKHKAVRDKLAAKRQLSATGPAEDLRATVELWR